MPTFSKDFRQLSPQKVDFQVKKSILVRSESTFKKSILEVRINQPFFGDFHQNMTCKVKKHIQNIPGMAFECIYDG